jgi:arylsulfatase A-like enzyme
MNGILSKRRNKMKRFLSGLICLFVLIISPAIGLAESPNVIVIFVDDLGYGDLSCYGATHVETPHIDRLATEGRMFTDAHSASAVCTPSRYALLTGEYPFRQGDGGAWGPLSHTSGLIIDTNKLTLGRLFQEEGYATACVGKWHLGFGQAPCDWNAPLRPGPLELGFDYYFGVPKVNSGIPYVYVENDRIVGWEPEDPLVFRGSPISPTPEYPEKTKNGFAGAVKAHELYHDERTGTILTEKAIDWIQENKADPFFLYFATTNIHHPFTPAPQFQGTSDCGRYGDFIHELDWMVGQLLTTLDEEGLADDTLVVFTSDNGGMYNEGGKDAWASGHQMNGDLLGFKFGAWEGGHRIPFLVRWPGRVEPGTDSDQLISSIDLLGTMADMLDRELTTDQAVDSFNVMAAMTGEPDNPIRDHLIHAPRDQKNLTLRQGEWVYIGAQGDGGQGLRDRGGPQAVAHTGSVNSDVGEDGRIKAEAPQQQLYNLNDDPSQRTNVILQHPELADWMQTQLDEMRAQPRTRP